MRTKLCSVLGAAAIAVMFGTVQAGEYSRALEAQRAAYANAATAGYHGGCDNGCEPHCACEPACEAPCADDCDAGHCDAGCDAGCDTGCCDAGCSCCPGPYATFSWMRWRARRSPAPYAGVDTVLNGNLESGSYIRDLVETGYDRDNAYRFGVGYMMSCCTDVAVYYTTFDADGTSSVGNPFVDSDLIGANLISKGNANDNSLNGDFAETFVDFAAEALDIDYDVYDIEIGRTYEACCGLRLRTFAGIRRADIEQAQAALYTNLEGAADVDLYLVANNVDMEAWGVRIGSEAHYGMGGVSLFGRSAISMLYGEFDVETVHLSLNSSIPRAKIQVYRHEFNTIVPVIEVALGVRYESCSGWYTAAGYDFANWFNMPSDIHPTQIDDSDEEADVVRLDRGDLSIDGWFVEGGYAW